MTQSLSLYIYIYTSHVGREVHGGRDPGKGRPGGRGRRKSHCDDEKVSGIFARRGFRPENPRKRTKMSQ